MFDARLLCISIKFERSYISKTPSPAAETATSPPWGLEEPVNSTGNKTVSETDGAESGEVDVQSGAVDADLTRIIDAWSTLPADVKTAIARLIENSGYAPATD
jgi:hypothetical protein